MKNLKIKRIPLCTAFFSVLAMSFSTANASEGMTWTGKVVAQVPQVETYSSPDPASHVEYVDFRIEQNAGVCDLVIDSRSPSSTYVRGQKPVCVVEYYGYSHGYPLDSLDMSAILTSYGGQRISYRVSVINNGQSHVILDESHPMDITRPTPSVITNATSKVGSQTIEGFELYNFDKRVGFSNLTVHVEPKVYDQRVTVDEDSCIVPEGETSCELPFTDYIPGLENESLQGTDSLLVRATDTRSHTPANEKPLDVHFDYRPPQLLDFVANVSQSSDTISHTVDGMDFEIPRNKGLLVVQTPHFLREDDWWQPEFSSLSFVPEEITESYPTSININGREIPVPSLLTSYRPLYNLRTEANPQLISDKMVFEVDLSSLPDGRYAVNAVVQDQYSNSSDRSDIEKLVDRSEPHVFGILDGDILSDNGRASTIFLSDFHVYVASGWNDGTTLDSVIIDGESFGFTQVDNNLYRLDETSSLSTGETYNLSLNVIDDSQNLTTRDFELQYADANFNLYTRASEVYANIQYLDITLNQQYGQRCQFTTSAELAVEISSGSQYKGCTIDQSSIPNGLNLVFNRRNVTMEGALEDVGQHNVQFDVVYHNHNGETKAFRTNMVELEALPAGGITLEMLDRNKVEDGLYAIPHNSRFATDFTLDYLNAEIALDIHAAGNSEAKTIPQTRRTEQVKRKVRVNRVDGSDAPVWSTVQYRIDASYVMQPSSQVSEVFDVLITPSSSTRAFLEIDDTTQYTTEDEITFHGSVGVYDRSTRSTRYIPEIMGDWEAVIAVRDANQFVPINTPQPVDSEGNVSFTVSGESLFEKSRQFFMLARSVSEYDQFNLEVRSNSANLEILKAAAVEGEIRARRVESRIPYDTSIFFDYKTSEDEMVADDFEWQISTDDGSTWSSIPSLTNRKRINLSIDEVGETKYRVAMRNTLSNISSYSEEISIIGYEVVDIRLDGPTSLFVGLTVDYEVSIPDDQYTESDGLIEWSLDGGETWSFGNNTLTVTPTDNFKLGARYKLNSSVDIENDDTYTTKFLNVRVREPRPLSLAFNVPNSIEVGQESEFIGQFRSPYRGFTGNISELIVLPDGTRVPANSIAYIPIASDVESGTAQFTYAAWIDGLEESTYSEVTRDISAYNYQFNMPELSVRQRYQINPTPVYATISLNVENPSPNIDYQYDWELNDEGIEVLQDNDDRMRFNINSSGNKMIGVTVSDNRGNEAEITRLLTVREPLPMDIELTYNLDKRMATVPLGVTMRSRYTFEHPRDYPVAMNWFLNGELVGETRNTRYQYQIDEPGDHELKLVVESAYGQVGEESINLNIGPNIPPYCDPNVEDRGTKIVIAPNCRDDDGNIVATYYSWDGQSELRGYSRISFNKSEFPNNTVTLRTVDNGGEEVVDVVTW